METDSRPSQPILLEPDEFEQAIKELHVKCERWLSGQETSASLLTEFDKARSWHIKGFCGLPDNFDWDAVPKNLMQRVENLYSTFDNALPLMAAVEKTVESLKEVDNETTINRAYYLGKYLQEFRYTPEC